MSSCPKCGASNGGAACPKCGLIFEKFDPRVLDERVPTELLELWDNLVQDWDERSQHALFLERALMLNQAGFAAQRYRSKGDDPTALQQIDRLRSRLEQNLLGRQRPRRAARSIMKLIGFGLLILAVAATMFLFLRLRN